MVSTVTRLAEGESGPASTQPESQVEVNSSTLTADCSNSGAETLRKRDDGLTQTTRNL